ncbi:MAG: M48 family metalloprotease [Gemmatimonadetes bacterium]|nr:M48 family metalloprotease [Gemmatimonadota bacterium]
MNAALNELGSQLFGWFSQLSIELAALAVLVLVASYLLPIKSPALRHLLWTIVLLKPLVSIAVSSPYTLFTPFVPLVEPSQDTLAFSPVEHPTMQVAASPTIATSSVQLTTAGWGAILWIAGAVLLIGRILIGYGIVWCLRSQAQVQRDGPLCDALRQARLTLDCYSKVGVATSTSPSISSPMALGILRPIIVFPADLVEKLRTDELALILMHELAHVRRWDNLTRLLHRLVAAVLFFHPAIWLCGRMLRREAEQACDDLVVCATGRSEAYARGLAHVAERVVHSNPLIRRIPTMNAFAAESDLALRIRRTLGGGARQMGMRTRVLVAVLLCPLAAVTLPSVSKISAESSQDERPFILVKQDDKPVTFATLKEDLQAKRRLLDNTTMIVIQSDERAPHGMIAGIMDIARQVGLVDQVVATEPQPEVTNVAVAPSQNDRIWQEAMATNPDRWSDELKTQLLELKPGNISYEITTASSAEELFIWNVAGELVRTFFLGDQSPGKYSIVWDGRDDVGRERSNGVYFYALKSDKEKHIGYRMILVR